jgi:L-aspartate oxidase
MTKHLVQQIEEILETEVLVVGGGVAGLSAIINAAPRRCLVVCRGAFGQDGSSPLAQGGVAVPLGDDDSPEQHAADTLTAGAGLSDVTLAQEVAQEGVERISELIRRGALFDRDSNGELSLGREAAHSRDRILHADGDRTGAEIVRTLKAAVGALDSVSILEHSMVLRLLRFEGAVAGAVVVDRQGRARVVKAKHVILATGGVGGLYRNTTNPVDMRGDGIALASSVGAKLRDLEFVQFHPTALANGADPMSLITEAMRGEGARLLDAEGIRLMVGIHPDLELAPRDVVARRIWRVAASGRQAYLDARHLGDRIETRFPTVWELCRESGFDPRVELIPVAAAAHYLMGGIEVDRDGRSSVPGLWACGEVARTGLHGANRLASNSLLEALVFGTRVGRSVSNSRFADSVRFSDAEVLEATRGMSLWNSPWLVDNPVLQSMSLHVREAMWEHVGLERDDSGLRCMLELIRTMSSKAQAWGESELTLMLKTAQLITRSAVERSESVGAHYRRDATPGELNLVKLRRDGRDRLVGPTSVATG